MENSNFAPSTKNQVISALRQQICDIISQLSCKKQTINQSLVDLNESIEKFVSDYSWFNSISELTLKIDSGQSWQSIVSHPDTPGLISYFYLFVRETEGTLCPQSVKNWKKPQNSLSSIPRQLNSLWKKHRYEFIRNKLTKLNEKWLELLTKKKELERDLQRLEESEEAMDKILSTNELILNIKEEELLNYKKSLNENSNYNENIRELKEMITNLASESNLNYSLLKKVENEKIYEALDTEDKENSVFNYHKNVKIEDSQQLPMNIGKIRNCLDEIHNCLLRADNDTIRLILADYFIVDTLGVKNALGRTNYKILTIFKPLSEEPPLSTSEAKHLCPRSPNFNRKLSEWEIVNNQLSWEFRLNFPHLTVYDLCLTLIRIQEGQLNFDFSVKYQEYYPWTFKSLICPPGTFLSTLQKSYISNLVPNCKIITSPESNSSVIQIFSDNFKSVIYNRRAKAFKKHKPVDFRLVFQKRRYN